MTIIILLLLNFCMLIQSVMAVEQWCLYVLVLILSGCKLSSVLVSYTVVNNKHRTGAWIGCT